MSRSHQLAAIMFTDIQGYTALMQQNEEKAIQVRDKHRRIFNSITEKHNGKILQYYGDGTLSVFDSAIDAVKCGIEMQLGFQEDPAIPVRIGIHTGDILFSEEEIIGDSVNVASRIESLAVPGSVFISEKVYDEVKNQQFIQTSLMKSFQLKNIAKPIEVYAISNKGLVVPNPEDITGKTGPAPASLPGTQKSGKSKIRIGISLALLIVALVALLVFVHEKLGTDPNPTSGIQEKSIAVLAFKNMSGDPEQEYFSDGISEEILNALTGVHELKVAGRTSAFSFKGKEEDIRKIGEKLDVKMVLEGSVRKSGNQVRITAQLINVDDGFHIWSETYDRELKDIFAVQEDIANRIVEKLKLQVQGLSQSKGRTQNMKAYESVLKGIYYQKRDFQGILKALESFQKAVELDPEYAEAYAHLGEAYLWQAGSGFMSAGEAYSNARTTAQKALSLNAYEPRAHKVLAYIHLFYDWDWEAALVDYDKSIEYGLPNQNEFMTYYDIFVNKDYDHAIRISKRLLNTDPLRVESHWELGLCYYFAKRFKEALASFDNALALDPNHGLAHHWRGVALGYLGRFDEAIEEFDRSTEISQGKLSVNVELLVLKVQMGKKEEAQKMLKDWVASGEVIDPLDPAIVYANLGMNDEAFFWLEKGYRERSIMMVTLKHLWIWDPIRDDPRFAELYERMNFSK